MNKIMLIPFMLLSAIGLNAMEEQDQKSSVNKAKLGDCSGILSFYKPIIDRILINHECNDDDRGLAYNVLNILFAERWKNNKAPLSVSEAISHVPTRASTGTRAKVTEAINEVLKSVFNVNSSKDVVREGQLTVYNLMPPSTSWPTQLVKEKRLYDPAMYQDQKEQLHTDCAFLVEDQIYYSHKVRLCLSSRYFQEMFSADFREKFDPKNIILKEIKASTFEQVLRWIYLSEFEFSGEVGSQISDMCELIHAAQHFQVADLDTECEFRIIDILKNHKLDEEGFLNLLAFAERHKCNNLFKACEKCAIDAHKNSSPLKKMTCPQLRCAARFAKQNSLNLLGKAVLYRMFEKMRNEPELWHKIFEFAKKFREDKTFNTNELYKACCAEAQRHNFLHSNSFARYLYNLMKKAHIRSSSFEELDRIARELYDLHQWELLRNVLDIMTDRLKPHEQPRNDVASLRSLAKHLETEQLIKSSRNYQLFNLAIETYETYQSTNDDLSDGESWDI